jgi:hypothetical protein
MQMILVIFNTVMFLFPYGNNKTHARQSPAALLINMNVFYTWLLMFSWMILVASTESENVSTDGTCSKRPLLGYAATALLPISFLMMSLDRIVKRTNNYSFYYTLLTKWEIETTHNGGISSKGWIWGLFLLTATLQLLVSVFLLLSGVIFPLVGVCPLNSHECSTVPERSLITVITASWICLLCSIRTFIVSATEQRKNYY